MTMPQLTVLVCALAPARQEWGIGPLLLPVTPHLVPGWGGVRGRQGLPGRQLAGAWGGEGADAGGRDQAARQGGVEVEGEVGREGGVVDLEPVDLELQELKLVKPVLEKKCIS